MTFSRADIDLLTKLVLAVPDIDRETFIAVDDLAGRIRRASGIVPTAAERAITRVSVFMRRSRRMPPGARFGALIYADGAPVPRRSIPHEWGGPL